MMYYIGYCFYVLGLLGYKYLIVCASLFNAKAKQFIDGRKQLRQRISSCMETETRKRIWFHCASLGEFEQARPLIEQFKADYPSYAIVITFFSPSGYQIRKDYNGADYVFYLPLDSNANATEFIKSVNPSLVFFVKYEIWYYYLKVLAKNSIPVFLISANFRPNHIYFKWYGLFFKKMLHRFNHIFCQNLQSYELLNTHGFNKTSVSKDTRFDRVVANSQQVNEQSLIKLFKEDKKILIAGSSYTAEETIIAESMQFLNDWKVIIAPHHINQSRITEIVNQFAPYNVTTYSALMANSSLFSCQVLVMDNMGMLSSTYQYGNMAFIGGGFGKSGLHNTLEAAVFGMPILFGPNNLKKFPESIDMMHAGIAFVVTDAKQFSQVITDFTTQPQKLTSIALSANQFIVSQTGATQHIFKYLVAENLLP